MDITILEMVSAMKSPALLLMIMEVEIIKKVKKFMLDQVAKIHSIRTQTRRVTKDFTFLTQSSIMTAV